MEMTIAQILAHACVVFAGVIIGVVICKFIDMKLDSQSNFYHFYVTFICVNSKGKRVYRPFTVDLQHKHPTEEELEQLRQNVLTANSEYKDCAIMSWIQLGVKESKEDGCNKDS